jgi:hypothetical protein
MEKVIEVIKICTARIKQLEESILNTARNGDKQAMINSLNLNKNILRYYTKILTANEKS